MVTTWVSSSRSEQFGVLARCSAVAGSAIRQSEGPRGLRPRTWPPHQCAPTPRSSGRLRRPLGFDVSAMKTVVAIAVCFVFVVLALWHFRMALAPAATSKSGAVPSVEGKPLFAPSTKATVAVGLLLLSFGLLVAATAGLIDVFVPQIALVWLSYGLALGLLGRAVGEFRYVGFFKRVRGSRFATPRYTGLLTAVLASGRWRGLRGLAQRRLIRRHLNVPDERSPIHRWAPEEAACNQIID